MAFRYLIVKMSRRVYITILSIAVVVMFASALFILSDSFRESSLSLLGRFKSNYYCICSTEKIYESYVDHQTVEIVNGSACVITKIILIKGNISYETYFLGIEDRIRILNYSGNELWMGVGCPITPGKVTIVGSNFSITSNIKKIYYTHFFPNNWIVGNLTIARMLRGLNNSSVNFIITDTYILIKGYKCVSMTTIIEFFKDGVREMNENLSLITLVAIAVSALLMNSVMSMDMKDSARTIAILKAIGVTRLKLFLVFLVRAIYIGCTASVIGFSLAVILSHSFVSIFPRLGIKSLFDVVIYPYIIIYSLLLGLLGAIIGGIPPIISALREKITKYIGVN